MLVGFRDSIIEISQIHSIFILLEFVAKPITILGKILIVQLMYIIIPFEYWIIVVEETRIVVAIALLLMLLVTLKNVRRLAAHLQMNKESD